MKKPKEVSTDQYLNAHFDIKARVHARFMGAVLAFLDGKAIDFDVALVKEMKVGGNVPRGNFKETVFKLLENGGMPIGDVKNKLVEFGFTRGTAHTSMRRLIEEGFIIRNKKGIVRIRKTNTTKEK